MAVSIGTQQLIDHGRTASYLWPDFLPAHGNSSGRADSA